MERENRPARVAPGRGGVLSAGWSAAFAQQQAEQVTLPVSQRGQAGDHTPGPLPIFLRQLILIALITGRGDRRNFLACAAVVVTGCGALLRRAAAPCGRVAVRFGGARSLLPSGCSCRQWRGYAGCD